MRRWLLAIAVNLMLMAAVYVPLRSFIFTPHQWIIDYVVLGVSSIAHFVYRSRDGLGFKLAVIPVSGFINLAGMFYLVYAVFGESL